MAVRNLAFVQVACLAVGLGCVRAAPPRRCSTSRDCSEDHVCVRETCRAPIDSGDGGAGAATDVGPRDAPSTDTPPADRVCVSVESVAVERRRPIDVSVLPDESRSMGPARDSVVAAMETTFRATMESEGIDYRVIWHGTTPLPMLEATGRLTRNPIALGSGDLVMFKPVLDTYDAWRPALRDDALKVFIHFTDATSGTGEAIVGYAGTFDEVLIAREPGLWGSAGDYRFVYHSFVGLSLNTVPDAPYEPSDPIVPGSCSSSFVSPEALQEMARRTGGLRFPLCEVDRFDQVFRRIAESAIARAAVPCEMEIPEAPAGTTLDLDTLAVRYTDRGGGSAVLLRADAPANCSARGFLLEADRVVLCTEACRWVESDPSAVLTLLTGCDPMLI